MFFDFFFFSTSLSDPPTEPVGLALFTGISSAFSGDLSLCSGDDIEPPMSSSLLVELQLLFSVPIAVGAATGTFSCCASTADGVLTVRPAMPADRADVDLGAGDDIAAADDAVAAAAIVGTVVADVEHISGVVGKRAFRPCRRMELDWPPLVPFGCSLGENLDSEVDSNDRAAGLRSPQV